MSIETAREIATRLHAGTKRAGGGDYIEHPAQVAALLESWGADNDLIAAAWLHDTIEDCGVDEHDLIADGITPRAAEMVRAVTRPEGVTYSEFIGQIEALGESPFLWLKIADLIANLSTPMPASKAGLERRYFIALARLLPLAPDLRGLRIVP